MRICLLGRSFFQSYFNNYQISILCLILSNSEGQFIFSVITALKNIKKTGAPKVLEIILKNDTDEMDEQR